ncbi:rCG29122 [Rattus norvegicus]|uniref:RCG29122 n=1 Tax=Rattus norvegicus TaxID=10116 RepID=A6HWJ5_RAT|nr:rCG29122 [Rattus norvegicus]
MRVAGHWQNKGILSVPRIFPLLLSFPNSCSSRQLSC